MLSPRTDSEPGKVVFRQYDGVAPSNYVRLFRPASDRKRDGKLARPDPKTAMPVFRMLLDAQSDYEYKIIADLSDKEQNSVAPTISVTSA